MWTFYWHSRHWSNCHNRNKVNQKRVQHYGGKKNEGGIYKKRSILRSYMHLRISDSEKGSINSSSRKDDDILKIGSGKLLRINNNHSNINLK